MSISTTSHEHGRDRSGASDVRHDGHILVVAGRRINPLRCCYYRVFNLCFDLGGRWYGHWVRQVPGASGLACASMALSASRSTSALVICAFFARAGAELGDGDPYDIAGLPRNEVKMAGNIMINAPTWRSARGALCVELGPEHGRNAGSGANQLRAAIMSRYRLLEPFWNSGARLQLQSQDAAVCMMVQDRLRRANVPCLSIHDSYIVPAPARHLATGVIDEEFNSMLSRLRRLGR